MIIAVLYSAFFLFSVFVSFKDIRTGVVSRMFMWISATVLFLLKYVAFGNSIQVLSVVGCILGLAVFFLAYICSGKKLGLADVWYAGIMGIILGPFWFYPAVICSCIFALVCMLITHKSSLPFIPFMAAGTWTVLGYMVINSRSV
jgi:hypothetical protein